MNSVPFAPQSSPPSAYPLRSVTRYLCAAAYLDTGFRNKVTAELLSDPYRAVASSHAGFDIGPVVHHCLRARAMLAVRDLLLTAVIIIGLVAAPGYMLSWLVVVAVPAVLWATQIRKQRAQQRLNNRSGLITVVMAGVLALVFVLFLSRFPMNPAADEFSEGSEPSSAIGWLLVLTTLVIVVGYRAAIGMLLSRELRPGATAPRGAGTPSDAARIAYLTEAQRSNLTLYSAENPFVGAGQVARAWAIAVELDRPKSSRARETPVIDPQRLYDFVGVRLAEMRDQVIRPAERLDLQIGDHVIARGQVNRLFTSDGKHPLIDPGTGLPVHRLGEAAVRAIVRQPKAGLRYYQRITVGTAAPEIRDENQRLVMPAEDQEVVVSAFVYLAVEGRMLYTEFIVTVLPPIADAYHLVDRLPRDGVARIALTSLAVLRGQLLGDLVLAPVRLVSLGYTTIRDRFVPRRHPEDYILYDYGARSSVREMGAEQGETTYLQQLDSFRYTKLIGERLNAGVLDFLEAHDIDTSAYRQQAAAIINNGTMISGGSFNGTTTVGAQSTVNQSSAPSPMGMMK
jgi:hypothetical protein